MILLLGGTADTDPIARSLVSLGAPVQVSTATDYPLQLPNHPLVERRCGALDEQGLRRLIMERGVRAVIDATHPYTELIGPLARAVTAELGVPCFRFLRPPVIGSHAAPSSPASSPTPVVLRAPDHDQAARMAFSFGYPVLLTIGSRNLGLYTAAARASAVPLHARVLDQDASIEACLSNGIHRSHIIAGRGPFSVKENTTLIYRLQIGVLVTKDSGSAGGVSEKLAAAARTGCRVVMVQRPPAPDGVFEEIAALTDAVVRAARQSPAGGW